MKHSDLEKRTWLASMYRDSYFPNVVVDQVRDVLIQLCDDIESKEVKNLDELYALSHAATERINALEEAFAQHGSEIQTGAREAIAEEFGVIANAYEFEGADIEELIAPRDW